MAEEDTRLPEKNKKVSLSLLAPAVILDFDTGVCSGVSPDQGDRLSQAAFFLPRINTNISCEDIKNFKKTNLLDIITKFLPNLLWLCRNC